MSAPPKPTSRPPAESLTGLPGWAVVALDGAIACGVLPIEEVDDLPTRDLLKIARALHLHALRDVNPSRVLKAAKT